MEPRGFVGSLPPTRSGVATYNLRCLMGYDGPTPLDVYAEQLDRSYLPRVRNWRAWPASRLGRGRKVPSTLVSTLGNNVYHRYAYEAVHRHGGVAWFHDTSLAGMHHQIAVRLGDLAAIGQYAANVLHDNYPETETMNDPTDLYSWAKGGRRFCRTVVQAADAVVVHSPRALEVLLTDAGVAKPPSLTIPLPVPDLRHTGPRERHRITSFGFLTPAKLPERVIEAAAQLGSEVQSVCWAGDAVGGFSALAAQRAATQHRLIDRFEITGHLSDGEYLQELARTSVAVQLRDLSSWNGEASGAVTEAIGAGIPVVTNIPPSTAEMAAAIISVSDDPSSDEVADALHRALKGDWDRTAGLRFAEAHRPRDVIMQVLDFADRHAR